MFSVIPHPTTETALLYTILHLHYELVTK